MRSFGVGAALEGTKGIISMAPARLVTALIGLCVAGCSSTPLLSLSDPPKDYRQITANYLVGLPAIKSGGALISVLQQTKSPQPADWFACLRLKSGDYYTVFFINGSVDQVRRAVVIDHCPGTYEPLPAVKTKKPT